MLKFSQFLLSENAHHGLEKDVRADLNEEQFAHTMNKYIEGRSKAKASGETDWNKLHEAGLKHAKSALLTHEQLSDKGKAAFNNLSHKESEANRTLWDTHHGALSTIHALHKQGIHPDGKAEVMGGDVTGKGAAAYLRGEGKGHIEDPSDEVSHTEFKVGTRHKNGKQEGTQRGTLGLSLKYSASKEGDTKISQPKSARIIEYTGKWGAKAMKVLQKITSLRNAPREWIKKQPALTGLFPEDKITDKHLKMFRYANTALNPKNPPETRKTYKDRVKTHLSQMGITATREQNRAIKTIADTTKSGGIFASDSKVFEEIKKYYYSQIKIYDEFKNIDDEYDIDELNEDNADIKKDIDKLNKEIKDYDIIITNNETNINKIKKELKKYKNIKEKYDKFKEQKKNTIANLKKIGRAHV